MSNEERHNYHVQHQQGAAPQMVTNVDPYYYQMLQGLVGRHTVVETTRGSVRGTVSDVNPDHIVLDVHNAPFYIRIQQIIWVMPY